jgi:hypothetical protein
VQNGGGENGKDMIPFQIRPVIRRLNFFEFVILCLLIHDVIYKKFCLRMMGVVFFIGDI